MGCVATHRVLSVISLLTSLTLMLSVLRSVSQPVQWTLPNLLPAISNGAFMYTAQRCHTDMLPGSGCQLDCMAPGDHPHLETNLCSCTAWKCFMDDPQICMHMFSMPRLRMGCPLATSALNWTIWNIKASWKEVKQMLLSSSVYIYLVHELGEKGIKFPQKMHSFFQPVGTLHEQNDRTKTDSIFLQLVTIWQLKVAAVTNSNGREVAQVFPLMLSTWNASFPMKKAPRIFTGFFNHLRLVGEDNLLSSFQMYLMFLFAEAHSSCK